MSCIWIILDLNHIKFYVDRHYQVERLQCLQTIPYNDATERYAVKGNNVVQMEDTNIFAKNL